MSVISSTTACALACFAIAGFIKIVTRCLSLVVIIDTLQLIVVLVKLHIKHFLIKTQMTNRIERELNLDVLRSLSIIGVVLIHIIGASFQYWHQGSLEWAFFIATDQFFRFSVPLFVFISGYTLYSKYNNNFKFWEFYTKRALRILPWYLLWSLIIYIYINISVVPGFVNYQFWKLVLLGKVDYHLYFVSMIIQLYILFPILLWLYKKLKLSFLVILFMLTAILYFVFTQDGRGIIQLPWRFYEQQQYLFFGTWVFYFVLGFVLADQALSSAKIFLKRYKFIFLLAVLTTLFLTVFNCFQLINSTVDTNVATRSTRIPILLYSTVFVVSAFLFSDVFLKLNKKLLKAILYFANLSFLVYLIHALVIRIVGNFIRPDTLPNLILFTLLILLISTFLAQLSLWTAQIVLHNRFVKLRPKK